MQYKINVTQGAGVNFNIPADKKEKWQKKHKPEMSKYQKEY